MTLIHTELEGDAWFPQFSLGDWRELKRTEHPADDHAWPITVSVMERAQ